MVSRFVNCFSELGPVFGCLEKNFQATDGECDRTPLKQHIHHANTRGPRLHILCPKKSCHPRVMSRSLPHLTLTTSTSSLSPTSPIFPTFPSLTPRVLWRTIHIYPEEIHGRVADQHKSHLSHLLVGLFSPSLLLGGAAFFSTPLGSGAFHPAPVGAIFSGNQHHPQEGKEGRTTKRRRRRSSHTAREGGHGHCAFGSLEST